MLASKCLASVMVVLVAAACVVHAQERIKMCGRELIRVAVSACGISRQRRSITDGELGQHELTHHRSHDDASTEAETAHVPPESDGEEDTQYLAPHWYRLSSRVRRAPGRIPDICCEKGCSVKELIQFC